MNLVCFPPYGGGGYVCDVLNGTTSTNHKDGTVGNVLADSLKIAVPRSFRHFKSDNKLAYQYFFQKKVQEIKDKFESHMWLGTHCYPDEVNMHEFDKVIVISTENVMSKIYRFMRVYFMYDSWAKMYSPNEDKTLNLEEKVGKIDLSLYNFNYHNVVQSNTIQLEMQDLIEDTPYFSKLIDETSYNRDPIYIKERKQNWQLKNYFLYDKNFVQIFENRYKQYMETQK